MKKFIWIAVVFLLMLIFIGCSATMTPEQRKEKYQDRQGGGSGLSGTVGESLFVGSTKPQPGTLRYHEMFGY